MKIMIDATSLARKITGIENYTKNLVGNIIEINKEKNNELYILFRGDIPKYLERFEGFIPLVCPFKSQLLCEQIWIPYINLKYKPDVIHFPAFPPPLMLKNKNTYFTVHDATMWKYKETLSIKNKLYMRPLSNLGIKRSKKILTVSNASLKNILDVFPQIQGKIVNTGISISPIFRPEDNQAKLKDVKNKYNLPSKYFLTVGSLEPRKNLKFLISSFIDLKKRFPNDYKLVITGRAAWGSQELKKMIDNKDIKNEVIFTGYVPDEDLVSIYTLADCFIYPSIYEGFGLPVLEAMACGTPVMISNTSSLPEVGGDAALYFSPYVKEELVMQMQRFIINPELKKELSKKGLERSKEFSWKRVADSIYKQYESN